MSAFLNNKSHFLPTVEKHKNSNIVIMKFTIKYVCEKKQEKKNITKTSEVQVI